MKSKVRKISTIKAKAKDIKLLIMDVDGVLTSGTIVIDELGKETKIYNVYDGFGLMVWKRAGLKSSIVTAGDSPAVKKRADKLGVDKVYKEAINKIFAYNELKEHFKVIDKEICFIGDDIIDIPLLKKAGLACIVPNAQREVRPFADYMTTKRGGEGAVREVIDIILKAKGLWKTVCGDFIK